MDDDDEDGAGSPPVVLGSLRERISYAIAIGAKGKRYRRIVEGGERLEAKSAWSFDEGRGSVRRRLAGQ